MLNINNYRLTPENIQKLNNVVSKNNKYFIDDLEIVPINEVNEVLEKEYNSPQISGKIGRDRFYIYLTNKYLGISRRKVMDFLKRQEPYQLHQPIYKQTQINPIIIKKPFDRWQVDLIDMTGLNVKLNKNYKWIMTVVDLFSKYAYAIPIKNKEAETVADALEYILKDDKPKIIQSDNGSEFISKQFKKVLKNHKVKQVLSTPYTPQSQGAVEKFNGTLKNFLISSMTKNNTKVWYELVDIFVNFYNKEREHSITGYKPIEIHKRNLSKKIKNEVLDKLLFYANKALQRGNKKKLKPIKEGDQVRVALHDKTNKFKKSYNKNWSSELFIVSQVRKNNTYKLKGLSKIFKREDLQFIKTVEPSKGEYKNKYEDQLKTKKPKSRPIRLIGTKIKKKFDNKYFYGKVVSFKEPYYLIQYDDGDEEEMTKEDIKIYKDTE